MVDAVCAYRHTLGRLRSGGDDVVPHRGRHRQNERPPLAPPLEGGERGGRQDRHADVRARRDDEDDPPPSPLLSKGGQGGSKGDDKKEANETFYLDLFGNSSNSLFTKNRGIGTILNDD